MEKGQERVSIEVRSPENKIEKYSAAVAPSKQVYSFQNVFEPVESIQFTSLSLYVSIQCVCCGQFRFLGLGLSQPHGIEDGGNLQENHLKKNIFQNCFFATGFQRCSAVEIYGGWGVLSPSMYPQLLETSSAHREKCLKVTPQPQQSAKVREPRPFAAQSRFLWSLEATLLKSYAHLMLPIDSFMKSHHQPPFAHLGIPGPPRSWQE